MSRVKTGVLITLVLLTCSSLMRGEGAAQSAPAHLTASIAPQTTHLVSLASNGAQANKESNDAFISGDGRYVAFDSRANNLVSGDTNNKSDVFLRDTLVGTTTRISVSSAGIQSNDDSYVQGITPDGRFILFSSWASNLVSNDTNNYYDGFLHDTQTGVTTRVTLAHDGSQGNKSSSARDLSANGRYIVFSSASANLVSGDTNGKDDIFLHDRVAGTTILISKSSSGVPGNHNAYRASLSDDGRYVVFDTKATNLAPGDINDDIDVYLHDTQTGQTRLLSASSEGQTSPWGSAVYPEITPDGSYVVFQSNSDVLVAGDENTYCPIYFGAEYQNCTDIFVYDLQAQTLEMISLNSGGSQGNDASTNPRISADGRYVIFLSQASNLVSGDSNGKTDVFFHDRQTAQTHLVSLSSSGAQGNGDSAFPDYSADGRTAVFKSFSSNLVSGDNNNSCDNLPFDGTYDENCPDIFLRKMMQFTDAPPSLWAASWIEAIYGAGITSGYPDGTYRPENPVTRAEMAVFLLNGMGVSVPAINASHPFSDISGHWAEAHIEELFDQEITGGYPDGTYRPENLVTRAEMAVFLLNALSISPATPSGPDDPFSDISGHWAESFILELENQGITGGYPDSTYRPENQVTRAEMAVFLVNAFGIPLP